MKQTMKEQPLTVLAQRFTEDSKQNFAVSYSLSSKHTNKYTYTEPSEYVGKAVEALRNEAGHFLGFSKGIPFVRTTKKAHEQKLVGAVV